MAGGDDIEKPLPPNPPPPPPGPPRPPGPPGPPDRRRRRAARTRRPRTRVGVAAPPPPARHRRRLPGMHVGDALVAEALDRLAGRRIERPQLVAGAVEQPRARLVVAGPVGHRAHRAAAHRRFEAPQFLAGLGLERDHAAVLQRDVHRRADDRPACSATCGPWHLGVELPRLGQLRDVLRRDLRQRREARVSRVVAVGGPAVLRQDGRRHARRTAKGQPQLFRHREPLKIPRADRRRRALCGGCPDRAGWQR